MQRIEWIDFAKGFTILFVILGHTLESTFIEGETLHFLVQALGIIAFSFIMPVFFAISGYLYKKTDNFKSYILMIYKKISSFLFIYILFNVILLIKNNNLNLKSFITIFFWPTEYTWFIYSLFLVFVIYGLFDLFHINLTFKFLIITILFCLTSVMKQPIWPEMSAIVLAFQFLPFFFLGSLLRNNSFNFDYFFTNKRRALASSMFVFLLFIINVLIFHINMYTENWTKKDVIVKLLLVILLFNLFKIFPKNKMYYSLEKIGKNSMILYLVHYPLLGLSFYTPLRNIIENNVFSYVIGTVIMYLFVLGISLFVVRMCKYKVINEIFYPRKYIDNLIKNTKIGGWMFS